MARKRRRDLVVSMSSGSDNDADFAPFDDLLSDSVQGEDNDSDDVRSVNSDDTSSTDVDSLKKALLKECYKDYKKKIRDLKMNSKKRRCHKVKKSDRVKSSDAFTRFSVKAFHKVIAALSPDQRKVIEDYGFGSLLLFSKCYVPNKFAQWIARNVDHRSGDIIIDGKIIPLTKESVHCVLDLPCGGTPFPADSSAGKSFVLEMFNKKSLPPVTFFANKITRKEVLSDEELLTCFMVVALHSFLCPNSSSVPSYRYFGVFTDVQNAKSFDWCGYVLDWLIQSIKSFNKAKCPKGGDPGTLGGCIYYLAVLYLDHVDFGPRRVSDSLPRISVWKDDMIKVYCGLDLKSPGCYGFRPLLDFSDTCYAKQHEILDNESDSLLVDHNFMDKLDSVSNCKLPDVLKTSICKIINSHCLNCGLRLDLDVTAISNLPENLVITFSKLLNHASTIDKRSKNLVLDILDLITHFPADSPNSSEKIANKEECPPDQKLCSDRKNSYTCNPIESQTHALHADHNPTAPAAPSRSNGAPKCNQGIFAGAEPPGPNDASLSYQALANDSLIESSSKTPSIMKSAMVNAAGADKAKDKFMTRESTSPYTPIHKSQDFVFPTSGYPSNRVAEFLFWKSKAKMGSCSTLFSPSNTVRTRQPLVDLSNVDMVSPQSKSKQSYNSNAKDVIMLDDEVDFVPDSTSPYARSTYPKFCAQKEHLSSENGSQDMTEPENNPKVTPVLSKKHIFTPKNHSMIFGSATIHTNTKGSPEVQFVGQKSLSQNVSEMTKKSGELYNRKLHISDFSAPNNVGSSIPGPSGIHPAPIHTNTKGSPEVQFVGQKSLSQNVSEMTKKSDELYNRKLHISDFSAPNNVGCSIPGPSGNQPSFPSATDGSMSPYKPREFSTGGKLPPHGPRRAVFPGPLFRGDYVVPKNKISVCQSEMKNYNAICRLANSKYSTEDAVCIGKVRCTFWSLGDSLKPGGFVNSFVISAFCYSLFIKPNGHPDKSKCHFYFANIAENLLKDPDESNIDVLSRAFRRSHKLRPLNLSNNLYFPTLFNEHWFLFVVDIKDRKFVFLDPLHHKEHQYQEFVRDRLIPSFQLHWDRYIQVDMNFYEYELLYPDVPKQPSNNCDDSGIYTMMFLQHWRSPRTVMRNIFDSTDIVNIRVKIANDLMFLPGNSGKKDRVLQCDI